ncbi:hypothetical protein VIGAN_04001900 [Vigna angularis var. angularis]|nr:hypothetical protein VIGAN_04001900 [Vigna angularis var. angularis]
MPFNLSFTLTLSAIMWFGYGLFLKDICIALPNVLGFALGLIQMVLYAIYRNGNKKVDKMQKKAQVEQLKSGEVFHVEENEQEQKKEETMAEKESDEPNDCRV